jgi:hypothetical protein
MHQNRCIAAWLAAAALTLPACALAGEPEQPHERSSSQAVPAAAPVSAAANAAPASSNWPGLDAVADPNELDRARGRNGVSATATVAGTVSGNAATQVTTGSNVIQSGSFANSTGLPVVVQNSGANVLIQSSTVINLELK